MRLRATRQLLMLVGVTIVTALPAQPGRWIGTALDPAMSGAQLGARGTDFVVYTRETSRFMYGFETGSAQWTVADLDSPRVIRALLGSGQTAMAWTDDLLFGYSAATSTWDTVRYDGTVINPFGQSVLRGYGCGDSLAYVCTDRAWYVFDSGLGEWRSMPYTDPGNVVSRRFWAGDDYAGVILDRNPPDYPVVLAYSLPRHAFNVNYQGGWYHHPDWEMTHGFVTYWGDGAVTNIITGYSAADNQFAARTVLADPGHFSTGDCGFPDHYLDRTIAVYHHMESQGEARIYAYDTRRGHWDEASHWFDPQHYSGLAWWHLGGQAGASGQYNSTTREMTYLTYSGITGGFNTWNPGLYYCGSIGATANGAGDLVIAVDTSNVWFFNPQTASSHTVALGGPMPTGWYLGDCYATTGGYVAQGSPVTMHIYNSRTDNVMTIPGGPCWGITVQGSPSMCAYTTGVGRSEVYLYSSLLDDYTRLEYPPNSYPAVTVYERLATVNHAGESYLYDAGDNSLHPADDVLSGPVGRDVALFRKDMTVVKAYSAHTGQWSEFAIPEGILGVQAEGSVGLVYTPFYGAAYAYNGYGHNLVRLSPSSGQFAMTLAGDNTVLMAKPDSAWAFDPQAATAIPHGGATLAGSGFRLDPNYPNPFNPATRIAYRLARSGEVRLVVYDVLGRAVRTLVAARQRAGAYECDWDGRDERGVPAASGVYFYQLRSGDRVLTRKMLLVR